MGNDAEKEAEPDPPAEPAFRSLEQYVRFPEERHDKDNEYGKAEQPLLCEDLHIHAVGDHPFLVTESIEPDAEQGLLGKVHPGLLPQLFPADGIHRNTADIHGARLLHLLAHGLLFKKGHVYPLHNRDRQNEPVEKHDSDEDDQNTPVLENSERQECGHGADICASRIRKQNRIEIAGAHGENCIPELFFFHKVGNTEEQHCIHGVEHSQFVGTQETEGACDPDGVRIMLGPHPTERAVEVEIHGEKGQQHADNNPTHLFFRVKVVGADEIEQRQDHEVLPCHEAGQVDLARKSHVGVAT